MKFLDVRELNINELSKVVIRYCLPLRNKAMQQVEISELRHFFVLCW